MVFENKWLVQKFLVKIVSNSLLNNLLIHVELDWLRPITILLFGVLGYFCDWMKK